MISDIRKRLERPLGTELTLTNEKQLQPCTAGVSAPIGKKVRRSDYRSELALHWEKADRSCLIHIPGPRSINIAESQLEVSLGKEVSEEAILTTKEAGVLQCVHSLDPLVTTSKELLPTA